jgi:Fe-Mn family superoxide dismutase
MTGQQKSDCSSLPFLGSFCGIFKRLSFCWFELTEIQILRRLSFPASIEPGGGFPIMDRRSAIKHLGGAAGALLLTESLRAQALPAGQLSAAPPPVAPTGPFTLPPLPYSYDALEPYFDAATMHLHHDKHHQSYVNNLNAIVAAHPELSGKSVEELVANVNALPEAFRTAVRNNGGGHANHSFWWPTLGKGGAAPNGELAKAIDAKFGSLVGFQEKLTAAALSVFGSGWAWLVKLPDGSVAIETTANQESPLTAGHKPVLTVDVWEHAYYLKYQNRRVEYVKAFFQVVNWDYVSGQFAQKA